MAPLAGVHGGIGEHLDLERLHVENDKRLADGDPFGEHVASELLEQEQRFCATAECDARAWPERYCATHRSKRGS